MKLKCRVTVVAFALCVLMCNSVFAATGGPDAHGYRWWDNQGGDPTPTIIGTTLPATWTNYHARSTQAYQWDSPADDNGFWVSLPFLIRFYGTNYPAGSSSVWICSNGYVCLGTSSTTFRNREIPNTAAPNSMIAGLYDDLNPAAGGTLTIRISSPIQSPPFVIVQYENVPQFDVADQNSFMIVIYASNGVADSEIHLVYERLSGPNDPVTIGIENQQGTIGLPYINNLQQVPPNGTVIRISSTLNEPPLYPTHQHVFPRGTPAPPPIPGSYADGRWHGCIAVEPWLTDWGGGNASNLCREGITPHHPQHGLVLNIEDSTPRFTCVYRDPPGNLRSPPGPQTEYDTANRYQLLVSDATGRIIWDSGSDPMPPVTDTPDVDDYIQPIAYGSGDPTNDRPPEGAPRLQWGTTYLWAIRLFDDEGMPSPWSDVGGFTLRPLHMHGRAHTGEGGGEGGNCLLEAVVQNHPAASGGCALLIISGLLVLWRIRRR